MVTGMARGQTKSKIGNIMQTSKTTKATATLIASKKPYKPAKNTAQENTVTWATIQEALAKGPQTRAALETLVKEKHNHKPFIGYAIRRGWLV